MAIALGVCCHRGIAVDSSAVVWSDLLGVVVKVRRKVEVLCEHCGRRKEAAAARSTILTDEVVFIVVAFAVVYLSSSLSYSMMDLKLLDVHTKLSAEIRN